MTKREACLLQDDPLQNRNQEAEFFVWLKRTQSAKTYETIKKYKSSILMILMQHKIVTKNLFQIDEIKVVNDLIYTAPNCFANAKLKAYAGQMIKLYSQYLTLNNSKTENDKAITDVDENNQEQQKDCDASQTDFYNWLSQHELLAGPTCRAYISGLRSSEKFAVEHDYRAHSLFNDDKEVAAETAKELLGDPEFSKQHSVYRSHLRKYIQYLGYEVPVFDDSKNDTEISKKETKKETRNLIKAIENAVKEEPDGILETELYDRFSNHAERQIRDSLAAADIIHVLNKYYHKDNIYDFELMAETILGILTKQFRDFGDYTSDVQLFKEAQIRLDDFFFFNGAFNSKLEVYELAQYLFGKAAYKNNTFVFKDKRHIWKKVPEYSMDFGGLLLKYAREHNNVFSRDEAIEYLEFHGSGTPAQTLSLILNRYGKDVFVQYAENQFVLSEALDINSRVLEQIRARIEDLLENDDYVALGDITDYFYSTLPELAPGIIWGPLLLESILERNDIGFITIDAGNANDLKTIDAALIRKSSSYKTFSDVVWNEISNDYQLPITLTQEEFRLYLLKKGFIHGTEKFYTVHKTVENDLRFYWTKGFKKVTVSNS